ncbi:hypothetical protein [Salinimicrobium oceani]|uniref:Uncharacterized protein n=1 Tax=Salinimicrobium oceani TaxID=2722702 RepID=A0ABX1D106_9FLAO|nr:hypothetical protein [Salinimicrobium oceani]NJW54160.1 hypothetical protein [Salinimicrobium oceani]
MRVAELIDCGFSDGDIAKKIYEEYSLNISTIILKGKRSGHFLKKVNERRDEDLKEKLLSITEALKKSSAPLSASEISSYILSHNRKNISKKEINQLIHNKLRQDIDYNRENFKYSLKKNLFDPPFSLQQEAEPHSKIWRKEPKLIVADFHRLFQERHIEVRTGNEKIDSLVKAVVKDNFITECEEEFLKQKTRELDLSFDLIEKAKKSLNSNNPYLDNILNVIFEDGKVTKQELDFLKEKTKENQFSKSFVNRRFLVRGIALHLQELLKLTDLRKFIKLWHIGSTLNSALYTSDLWLFTRINIFKFSTLEESLHDAIVRTEDELIPVIEKTLKLQGRDFVKKTYERIELREGSLFHEKEQNNSLTLDIKRIIEILDDEKIKIGTPDAHLLVENIKFRIENKLWV